MDFTILFEITDKKALFGSFLPPPIISQMEFKRPLEVKRLAPVSIRCPSLQSRPFAFPLLRLLSPQSLRTVVRVEYWPLVGGKNVGWRPQVGRILGRVGTVALSRTRQRRLQVMAQRYKVSLQEVTVTSQGRGGLWVWLHLGQASSPCGEGRRLEGRGM